MSVVTSLKTASIILEGLPPGLMYQGKGAMDQDGNGKTRKVLTPESEAALRCHWVGSGKTRKPCLPWIMLYRSLCQAGRFFKWRERSKMEAILASTISCKTDRIPFAEYDYQTHVEYVRIPPKTGAMVQIGRPLITNWKTAPFEILIDDEMWDATKLEEIARHAGKIIGVGANRPGLKGPYGKFVVAKFEIQ